MKMAGKAKILIIDDDITFQQELRDCLVAGGYHVLVAVDNVEDGLQAIQTQQPDGIVLDIQLRGKLGLEVLNHLTLAPKTGVEPVLIVVSSYINNRIVALLNKKKCLYFDKSYNYKHELVLSYFNDMMEVEQQPNLALVATQPELRAVKPPFVALQVEELIHQKLKKLGFNSKITAYEYLVSAIVYMLDPDQPPTRSLTIIFKRIPHIQYSSVFNGIKRLIVETCRQNPELFNQFDSRTKNANLTNSPADVSNIPTVKDFIYQLYDEIKADLAL